MRFWSRSLFFSFIKSTALFYRSPSSLNYWWNFGFFALIFLLIQILTGVMLGMFYTPDINLAFTSIIYINNEVYYGWMLRSLHATCASFFF